MLPVGRFILLYSCMALGFPAFGQKASNWRVFKASDGLAESFVTSVSVSGRSNVWVKHHELNAVSMLNGYKAKSIPAPGTGYYRVVESRSGQIWAAYPEGLQEFRHNAWIKYPIKAIRQEFQTNLVRHARSFPLVPLKQGRVLFLVSDRLMEFNTEWPPEPAVTTIRLAADTALGKFNDMIPGRNGDIWITGENGLARLSANSPITPNSRFEEFPLHATLQVRDLHQPLADDEGGLVAIGESLQSARKVVVHFDGKTWRVYHTADKNIRQAWRAFDGSIWAITIGSLLRLDQTGTFVESDDVVASQYFDVAMGDHGVFWLATSDGLFRFAPLSWRVPEALRQRTAPVHGLAEDAEGRLYVAFANSFFVLHNGKWTNHSFPEAVDKSPQPGEFLFPLPRRQVVFEANGQLIRFNPASGRFTSIAHPGGVAVKALGAMKDGSICVQVLDKQLEQETRLETFDGDRFQRLTIATPPLPPNTEINFAFTAANGDLWISGSTGLWQYHNNEWHTWSESGTGPDSALCMLEAGGGKIWCGTRDTIWEFDGKDWTIVRASVDRVNGMTKARDGTIWVASNSGLHRYANNEWTLNNSDDGLPSLALTEVFEDRRGRIWAGTMRGLAGHHPEADPDPPRTSFQGRNIAEDGTVTLTFGGMDKWKYTPPDQLLFSTRLDEQEWTPFGPNRHVSYSDLAGGKHYFQVRAMDRNWNIDPEPTLREFEVPIPWYQDPRLLVIAVLGSGAALFFAGLAFNRHRRLVRSYAEVERIVELRTNQLQEANAQLLHSQKMTALGTLAAGVAHDFNSILSIIKGSAQIIETNLEDREKIRTRAQRINKVVEQGSDLVQAMLGFSRPGNKEIELCDLNTLISGTIKLLGDRFQRDVQVGVKLAPDLPQVCAQKSSIQQILLNLIFNAADALSSPGRIVVESGCTTAPLNHLVLAPAAARAYAFIAVQDYGCGIAPEVLPRIFEPFFTTKAFSSRRGTGLGLSIVYELAKQMDAGLAVQSDLNKGSRFTLLIPLPDKAQGAFENSFGKSCDP